MASLSQMCACAALPAHQRREEVAQLCHLQPTLSSFSTRALQCSYWYQHKTRATCTRAPLHSTALFSIHRCTGQISLEWADVIKPPNRNRGQIGREKALTLQAKTYCSFFRPPIPRKLFERAAAKSSPHLLLRKLKNEEKGKNMKTPKTEIN